MFPFTELNRGVLPWIGTLSYALYLYHYLVIDVLQEYLTLPRPLMLVAALAITLPLCVASRDLIEGPAARLRKRFSS
jgi:peptidoglycan/LPS O-acetylase OafA/YrhL